MNQIKRDWSGIECTGIEKQCPICNRFFYVYDAKNYAFKIFKNGHQIHVCSWGCVRRYEKEHFGKLEAKKRRSIELQLSGSKQ